MKGKIKSAANIIITSQFVNLSGEVVSASSGTFTATRLAS